MTTSTANTPAQTDAAQATPSRTVVILWATYGTDKKSVEVSSEVQKIADDCIAAGKHIVFEVNNKNMGSNPDELVLKNFAIQYNYNGQNYSLCAKEKDTIDLDEFAPTINVLGALYGSTKGTFDVTAKVKALLDSVGPTTIVANNATFGDPCQGVKKCFGVKYEVAGIVYSRMCDEDGTVVLDAD